MTEISYNILFGLTADPMHKGHEQAIINSIEYCLNNKIKVKQVVMIPVYQPHLIASKKSPIASFKNRTDMCEIVAQRLSIKLNCKIIVSQIEKTIADSTQQFNYSYNTIIKLNLQNCLFMVSADHFGGRWPKFRKWFNWQEIIEISGLLINQRPKYTINQKFVKHLQEINSNIYIVNNKSNINISSTLIRNNINNNPSLSLDIINYIREKNIYKPWA